MPRKKLKRFAEIESFPNVIRWPENLVAGWQDRYFGNDNPLTLEIACGKGEYALGLARNFPDRNFIGIDRKGERIWRGAKTALDQGMSNLLFIQADAAKLLELFGEKTISEIWIIFPDPFPKKNKSNKRLTSPGFLEIYRKLMTPSGQLRLKTDDDDFFAYTIEQIHHRNCLIYDLTFDLHGDNDSDEILRLKTTYERRHLEAGRKIKYVRFGFLGQSSLRLKAF